MQVLGKPQLTFSLLIPATTPGTGANGRLDAGQMGLTVCNKLTSLTGVHSTGCNQWERQELGELYPSKPGSSQSPFPNEGSLSKEVCTLACLLQRGSLVGVWAGGLQISTEDRRNGRAAGGCEPSRTGARPAKPRALAEVGGQARRAGALDESAFRTRHCQFIAMLGFEMRMIIIVTLIIIIVILSSALPHPSPHPSPPPPPPPLFFLILNTEPFSPGAQSGESGAAVGPG